MSILPQLLGRARFWGSASILLAPRGEFDAGALALKSPKKQAFLALYKLLRLHTRIIWHASSAQESDAIRSVMGPDVPVLVRENETSLPASASKPELHSGVLKTVFISRITPKKGLLTALEALKSTKADLILDVYGPEEDTDYAARCREAASQIPANVAVRFLGPVQPHAVRSTLQKYDAMLFPTRGENFGHVIAESLSASCPVVCPPTTPWTQRIANGGGFIVHPNDPHLWKQAIEQLASLSPSGRLTLRFSAGRTYDEWRAASKGPHVFTLLSDAYGTLASS
jgi:glycosyltransferase involved in cell wall biosynthesis